MKRNSMGNQPFPIDRRTRVARAAREGLAFAVRPRKRGRLCKVCVASTTGHPGSEVIPRLVTVLVGLGATDVEIHRQVSNPSDAPAHWRAVVGALAGQPQVQPPSSGTV